MTIPRRTLTSLPSDVLHEILKLLLLDTPRTPDRTSVLQTCSLLHELGLPLLYRVVDLVRVKDDLTLLKHLDTLFFVGGLLTEQGALGRGGLVLELKMGSSEQGLEIFSPKGEETRVQPLDLPNCVSLSLSAPNFVDRGLNVLVGHIVSQLPLRNIAITSDPFFSSGTPACRPFEGGFLPSFLGLPHHQPLRRMDFNRALWFERMSHGGRQLSFWDWSFKILVVKLHLSLPKSADDPEEVSNLFFEPDPETEKDLFLKDTERVELRVAGPLAEEFEKGFREEFGKREARGLDAFERRIGSLIVFVGKDGEERRLV